MTFIVEPAGLTGYARQLERAADDADVVRAYVGKYARAATGGELISLANDSHQHAVEVVTGTLTRLTGILQASAPELAATAVYYAQTDRAAAIVIDRTIAAPYGQCPTVLEYEFTSMVCKPAPFADARTVESRLTAPPEPDTPPNSMAFMD